MVGLVNNKVKIKTLHEMIKEKTREDYEEEETKAKEFITEMRKERKEREQFKQLQEKKKK